LRFNDPGYIRRSRCARAAVLVPVLSLGSVLLLAPVYAALNARVLVDGKTLEVFKEVTTVREALENVGVTLDEDDQVTPRPEEAVPSDGKIRVSRIEWVEGTIEKPIKYQVVVRPATRGNRPYHPTVSRPGKNGAKRITYRAKTVDGKEVERTTLSEETVREPIHQIVISRNPRSLGSRGAYIGKRSMAMLTTAYDPGPGSCGKYANGITCNGKRAGYGIIAVDPKVIPLGTKLHVPGYGYGIAADVGGAIKGNRLDLGYNSRGSALRWGKKWVKVTIVD
jgi:3D (Asp-Asp-Asp) domain-containing protein